MLNDLRYAFRTLPPVAIASTALARKYWPGQNLIGKRLRFDDDPKGPWSTVMGIAGLTLAIVGVGLGLLGALAAARLLSTFLVRRAALRSAYVRIGSAHPARGRVPGELCAIARRALDVDPIRALRAE